VLRTLYIKALASESCFRGRDRYQSAAWLGRTAWPAMRVLVYAAGAYALCSGTAEAFAPKSLGGGLSPVRSAKGGRSSGDRVTMTGMSEDPTEVMARVDALMAGNSVQSVAAAFESSYTAPAVENPADAASAPASPTKRWEPYGGYDPAARRAAAPKEDAATIMARAANEAGPALSSQAPSSKREPSVR